MFWIPLLSIATSNVPRWFEHCWNNILEMIKRWFAFDWAVSTQVVRTNKHHHQLNARWQRGRSVWTGLLECLSVIGRYMCVASAHWTLNTLHTALQCTLQTEHCGNWTHCTLALIADCRSSNGQLLGSINKWFHSCSWAQCREQLSPSSTMHSNSITGTLWSPGSMQAWSTSYQQHKGPKTGSGRVIAHVSSWTGPTLSALLTCHWRCTIISSNTFWHQFLLQIVS